jgi:hypothetical protein
VLNYLKDLVELVTQYICILLTIVVPTSEAKTYEDKNQKLYRLFKLWVEFQFVLLYLPPNETFLILTTISIDYFLASHFVVQGTADYRESVCVAVQNGWQGPIQKFEATASFSGFMISVLGNSVLNLIANQNYKNTNKLQMETSENVRVTERLSRFLSVSGYRPVGRSVLWQGQRSFT